jgi:hypothetical protein
MKDFHIVDKVVYRLENKISTVTNFPKYFYLNI